MIYLFTEQKEREKVKMPSVLYEGDSGSWNGLPRPNSCWPSQELSAPRLGLQTGSLGDVDT